MSATRTCLRCGKEGVRVRKDGDLWRHWDAGRNETCTADESSLSAPVDPLMNSLIESGHVVPGDPAETHKRMLGSQGCHNGPSCTYCHPVSEPASTVDDMAQTTKPGPLFEARYDGECSTCDGAIFELDLIRATGSGGYECEACADRDDNQSWMKTETASQAISQDPPVTGPLVDSFTRPTKPVPQENVSGQPEADRDQWGRYLLPHPVTGEYSDGKRTATRRNGWMRATTFAKLAADTFALTRYDERLTLLGATLRPDVVALAHGKDVREDKQELDKLVVQVKDAAGAKVASNIGTAVHGFTERLDAETLSLHDVPIAYREHVAMYAEQLRNAGLEPVSGLIERTTAVDVAGRLIVGTFDRIYYVSRDTWIRVDGRDVKLDAGDYVIGDLKTGRNLSYGRMEIACQFALYARGVNAHGVFDWNSGQWARASRGYGPAYEEIEVRTDVGVVVHLPVQGDLAGTCTLMPVDLELGWSVAELNARVKNARDHKGYFGAWGVEAPVREPSVAVSTGLPDVSPWAQRAYSVDSGADAANVWSKAHADGASEAQLARLTEIMKAVLSRVDTEPPF